MKVTTHPNIESGNLGEIYQSIATKHALLKKGGSPDQFVRITPLVLCRDFLADVYAFGEIGRKFEIYGMKSPVEEPDQDAARTLISFPNVKAKEHFTANIQILLDIEERNNLAGTSFKEVEEEEEKQFVLLSSKIWLQSYPLLTLYTHLIRILCYEIDNPKDWIKSFTMTESGNSRRNEDAKLVASIHSETWDKILSDLSVLNLKDFCGFDVKKEDAYTIHHNSGIYSVFGRHRELDEQSVRKNSHWKHFKDQGTWKLHTN